MKSKTPFTDAEENRQRELYEKYRECGWPAFPVDFDFARRMEIALRAIEEALIESRLVIAWNALETAQ